MTEVSIGRAVAFRSCREQLPELLVIAIGAEVEPLRRAIEIRLQTLTTDGQPEKGTQSRFAKSIWSKVADLPPQYFADPPNAPHARTVGLGLLIERAHIGP